MFGLIGYCLSLYIVLSIWDPSGFLGFVGAMLVATLVSIPVYMLMMFAVSMFRIVVESKKP